MGQNNQKDQKGPKMTAAVMLVQNNQKIWSSHISHTILKVRSFGTPCIFHTCIFFLISEILSRVAAASSLRLCLTESMSGTECSVMFKR